MKLKDKELLEILWIETAARWEFYWGSKDTLGTKTDMWQLMPVSDDDPAEFWDWHLTHNCNHQWHKHKWQAASCVLLAWKIFHSRR